MSAVMVETLAWTGVLIAAVLVLRRPVAQLCGPQYAYALWALPLLRLLLPPLTLPAWMAPAQPAAAPIAASEPLVWQAEAMSAPAAPVDTGFDILSVIGTLPLAEALLLVWLGGAGVFVWRRFAAYFALRDELLAEGREVGRVPVRFGAIRLVETPGTLAPLAFGVADPVIAMPPGFMALHDRRARDLALAHELAHHRGLDLVVNVLVQPLFALHWWNPLGHYGWLALRRDQEAACDARVIGRADADERAAYARLIAGFAAVPNLAPNAAIAAPMACPVLGEKSIIHRLRSLSMSNLSPRRRIAGRALLAASVLALPLTATISYAASEAEQAAPESPPQPPAPPAVPQVPGAPQPPEAPEAPQPPAPPQPGEAIIAIDPDGEGHATRVESSTYVTETVTHDKDGKVHRTRVVSRNAPDQARLTEEMRASARLNAEQREELHAELTRALDEADRAMADIPAIVSKALAEAEVARAAAPKVMMLNNCDASFDQPSQTFTGKDGRKTIMICQSRMFALARQGLEEARTEIMSDRDIPTDTRKQLLRTLDSQIARWKEKEG
ncbi:M56 family metallopeptidase [Erythrobacter sp.]|uniref:M56 family metallopeptidase n=1 Tax=Erythrobacter sp. TaxID=1042 RepID=UPI0025FCF16E|nr:M56 family metallopeptidase [Erythrobacter sp.]